MFNMPPPFFFFFFLNPQNLLNRGVSSTTRTVWWSCVWPSSLRTGSLYWSCWPWLRTLTASSTYTTALDPLRLFQLECSWPTMSSLPDHQTHALLRWVIATKFEVSHRLFHPFNRLGFNVKLIHICTTFSEQTNITMLTICIMNLCLCCKLKTIFSGMVKTGWFLPCLYRVVAPYFLLLKRTHRKSFYTKGPYKTKWIHIWSSLIVKNW